MDQHKNIVMFQIFVEKRCFWREDLHAGWVNSRSYLRTPADGNVSYWYQKSSSEQQFLVPVGKITMRWNS
jgi:hypothetical protein